MLKPILPDIDETYNNKKFDVMLSMSHNLLKDKLDNSRVTGFNLDKNGNFRFSLNIFAQILVDKTATVKESAREIYLGFTYKGKLVIKEENGEKILLVVHKSAEVSSAKILKGNGEEMVME